MSEYLIRVYEIGKRELGADYCGDFYIWFTKYFPNNAPDCVIRKYARFFRARMWRKRAREDIAERVFADTQPSCVKHNYELLDVEDLKFMTIKDIAQNYGVSKHRAREIKYSMKYKVSYVSHSIKKFKFQDGEHDVLFVNFDFGDARVPTKTWRIKDTYAQYKYYKKLFDSAQYRDAFWVRFGSERGRQAGRIVWAQRFKESQNETNNTDLR